MIKLLLAASALSLLTACPPTCKPKMARCQGGIVQICRPDKKWQQVVDCTKVDKTTPWACACTDPQTCKCKKPVTK